MLAYYCCVDSENRPVNPPPEFVVPNKMEAWFAITDKFGCDPCEQAKFPGYKPSNPEKFKQCISYKKKNNGVIQVKFKNNVDAAGCAALADGSEKVETYFCEEGGGPPKDGECTPTPVPTAAKTYSYNFETMQPTLSPTPQTTPP